jgi:hypothetical protein
MAFKDLFFTTVQDPVADYRKAALEAVRSGDAAKLQEVLQRDVDVPGSLIDDIANRAIREDRLRLTEIVMKTGRTRNLDQGTLARVITDNRKDMFRLLSDHGVDFAPCAAPSSMTTSAFLERLAHMQKDYECDKLRAELAAVKRELTTLRAATGQADPLPTAEAVREPKKFDL